MQKIYCVKSVEMRSYFWSEFSCIQSECRKIWTRNNSVFGHFSRSYNNKELINNMFRFSPSYDNNFCICKTCGTQIQKNKIKCQTVCNKLNAYNFQKDLTHSFPVHSLSVS